MNQETYKPMIQDTTTIFEQRTNKHTKTKSVYALRVQYATKYFGASETTKHVYFIMIYFHYFRLLTNNTQQYTTTKQPYVLRKSSRISISVIIVLLLTLIHKQFVMKKK